MYHTGMTLREVLSQKEIAAIAPYAIKNMDLSTWKEYDKTIDALAERHFGGILKRGFDRLFAAAESGDWLYPLYGEAECAADPDKESTNLL